MGGTIGKISIHRGFCLGDHKKLIITASFSSLSAQKLMTMGGGKWSSHHKVDGKWCQKHKFNVNGSAEIGHNYNTYYCTNQLDGCVVGGWM